MNTSEVVQALLNGKTVDRKYIDSDNVKVIIGALEDYKSNCNVCVKQLKEAFADRKIGAKQ